MKITENNERLKVRRPVLVIAHRGASGSAPENTLSAFKLAGEMGADMVELDVHLSRDGDVMVIHDDKVDRLTNGSGMVADMTRTELQRLDAGSWFGKKFAGEIIPTLEAVLQLVKGKMDVNVEIKTGYLGAFSIQELVERTLSIVKEQNMLENVLFSSFHHPALRHLTEKCPSARRALLLKNPWQDSDILKIETFQIINCSKDNVTKASIRAAREKGLIVNVWTVNKEAEMKKLMDAGVNGIITNYPERLLGLIEKNMSLSDQVN